MRIGLGRRREKGSEEDGIRKKKKGLDEDWIREKKGEGIG